MHELFELRFNELLSQLNLAWYHVVEVPITALAATAVVVVLGFVGATWLLERGLKRLGIRPRPAWTATMTAICFVGLATGFPAPPLLIGWAAVALFAPLQMVSAWRNNPARARAAWVGGFAVLALFIGLVLIDRSHHSNPGQQTPGIIATGTQLAASKTRLFHKRDVELALLTLFGGYHLTESRWHEALSFVLIEGRRPHPVVAYLVVADLTHPDVEILITPEAGPKTLTSDFARALGATVAVNGEAGVSPRLEAPLGKWTGNWIVQGRPILLEDSSKRPALSFDAHNRARYAPAALIEREVGPEHYNTIWGRRDAVVGGEITLTQKPWEPIKPRTFMGIDATGETLYLLVVDGWQPDHSLGVTSVEAAQLIRAFGATDAMLCDQGGSSVMWVDHLGGIVSSPSGGEERPVYTHFGLRLRDMPVEPHATSALAIE